MAIFEWDDSLSVGDGEIDALHKELDSEEDTEYLASSVQRFLIDWLILHIKTTDRKLGEFLKGKT